MKFFAFALLVPVLAAGAILPDAIGPYRQVSSAPAALTDKPLWDEYGLRSAETDVYQNGSSKFTVNAWQLQDSTGALAAFDWQRPEKAKSSKMAPVAVETPTGAVILHGNYVLAFDGHKPDEAELQQVFLGLRNVDFTSLPSLPDELPAGGAVAGSQRYVLGPESLQRFAPGIPASVADFHQGAEGAVATYGGKPGDVTLAVFEYPTFQIAMQRISDFEKIPGAVAKRSGPLVAVTLNPPDPNLAERLLAKVQYRADVTMQEHIPTKKDNIGDLVINAFILTGILLLFPIVGGLLVGGMRAWQRRGEANPDADTIVSLHL